MPLFELSSDEALANQHTNPYAEWGDRSSPNRIEPIATPHFAVPFRIKPGEKIFTVGSCFARNVETELGKLGFQIPMRDLLRQEAFKGIDRGVINNFGTPSIYNEFAWAFGERPFVPEDHIVELHTGRFADLHLKAAAVRPGPWDVALARRRAVIEAYRCAAECRVVIMTLGLVEVWYDSRTGYYLNTTPLPSLLRTYPDRFKLHVLSFDEVYRYLEDTLLIIRRNCHRDVRVQLTVSPVPLQLTFRSEDVVVANSYSKSVLRAAAETAVARHGFVSYYPSYESVILSDRRTAWRDDLTHVTDEIVALNVGRMIDSFIETDTNMDDLADEIKEGGLVVALERARRIRTGSPKLAGEFFNTFSHFSRESSDFALEHAQFLLDRKQFEAALAVIEGIKSYASINQVAGMMATALIELGRAKEAVEKLEVFASEGVKVYPIWNLLLDAAMATGDSDKVISVLTRWHKLAPKRTARAYAKVGRWFHERGELDRAATFLRQAISLDETDATPRLHFVELLLTLGQKEEARTIFNTVKPVSPNEMKRLDRLKELVEFPSDSHC